MERGWREMAPNCPRCGSTNTKFCYYNNYSLTQPRYFCKGCRRYWTKGGSLRNVPVGGGCRKSRRGSKPSLRVTSVATTTPYPHDTPNSCRRTISAFGHVVMNSDGPSSSSSSSASTIDLAVVYANFLNPKGPQTDTFHDRLIIPPLDQIPSNRIYNGDQEDHLLLLHHHRHHHHLHNKHEDQGLIPNPNSFAYDHGTLLPPLPGEEDERIIIPWEKSNNTESNVVQSTIQDPLETETPFSSLFNVDPCWSPFDFSGYSDIQTTTPAGAPRQDQWP